MSMIVEPSKRQDPRYIEASADLSDWIVVRLAEQFGEQREANGLLCDLTPRAVRVAFPSNGEGTSAPAFQVGTQTLLVFRFRDLATVTATATVTRVDQLPNGIGMVFFFDFIRESDREIVTKICSAYSKTSAPS